MSTGTRTGQRARRLPDRDAGRPGRDGGRLPRLRPRTRAAGRAEDPRPRARGGRALPRALPARVPTGRLDRPPEHRPRLRRRRGRRRAVHRHALRRRRRPQAAARGGAAAEGRSRRDRRPDRRRPGRGACARARPPRRQTLERPRHGRRSRLPGRLRAHPPPLRPGGRIRGRALAGNARLCRAGADRGEEGGRAGGPVLARLPPARMPDRGAAVCPLHRGGRSLRPPRRGAAGAARARAGASEGARQEPGPALRNLCGAGRRRPPSARDRLPGAQPLAARGRSARPGRDRRRPACLLPDPQRR